MPSSLTKNAITFRFLRDNNTDDSDDIVNISYAGNTMYNISFRTPLSENPLKKPTIMHLGEKQTFRWVRRMMSLLECDTIPFAGIQVDMPMMPSIMLSPGNLSRNYNSLLDAVEFHMDNWENMVCPSTEVRSVPNAPARRRIWDEEDVADDDDSMPPLVPLTTSDRAYRTPPRVNRQHLFFDEE